MRDLLKARKLIRGIADIPRVYATLRPNHPAMIFEGRTTTYRDLQKRTNCIASGLIAAGLTRGSRFAVLGKNTDYFFQLYIGGAKAGVVLVAVNWRLALEEILYVIDDSESEVLFVSPEYSFVVDELKRRIPRIHLIISLDHDFDTVPSFEKWLAPHADIDPALPVDPEDVVIQLYTSGTTGHPKGAQLTNRSTCAALRHVDNECLGKWDADTYCLVCMPASHVSGSCWGVYALYSGATDVILREVNVELIIQAFEQFPITKTGFVPAVLKVILDHPNCETAKFEKLQTICYGGSPISSEILRRSIEMFGCEFIQVFGMTEVVGLATFLSPADHNLENPGRMLSCGRASPEVQLRIIGSDGRSLPAGQSGEILIKGDVVMKGYWKRPEATAEAIKEGWYHTGDVGEVDDDGYLYLRDRITDMVISGGENIYSREVEIAISSHPAVAEVAVIGVPDEKWGETVKAVIVRRRGSEITSDELISYSRTKIAHYKCPKSIDFVDALPLNASGKVLKRILRDPYLKNAQPPAPSQRK